MEIEEIWYGRRRSWMEGFSAVWLWLGWTWQDLKGRQVDNVTDCIRLCILDETAEIFSKTDYSLAHTLIGGKNERTNPVRESRRSRINCWLGPSIFSASLPLTLQQQWVFLSQISSQCWSWYVVSLVGEYLFTKQYVEYLAFRKIEIPVQQLHCVELRKWPSSSQSSQWETKFGWKSNLRLFLGLIYFDSFFCCQVSAFPVLPYAFLWQSTYVHSKTVVTRTY